MFSLIGDIRARHIICVKADSVNRWHANQIDFVDMQHDERVYVHVCHNLPEDSDREIGNLLDIKDHYPKYVVTLDDLAGGNVNGVKIVHLADFLLSDRL